MRGQLTSSISIPVTGSLLILFIRPIRVCLVRSAGLLYLADHRLCQDLCSPWSADDVRSLEEDLGSVLDGLQVPLATCCHRRQDGFVQQVLEDPQSSMRRSSQWLWQLLYQQVAISIEWFDCLKFGGKHELKLSIYCIFHLSIKARLFLLMTNMTWLPCQRSRIWPLCESGWRAFGKRKKKDGC